MFPNKIILQENKKLCTGEDKQKLATLKDLSKDVMSVLKKYFKTINKYSNLKQ